MNPAMYEWVPAGPRSNGGTLEGLASRFVKKNLVADDLIATDPAGNLFEWEESLDIFLDDGSPIYQTRFGMLIEPLGLNGEQQDYIRFTFLVNGCLKV